MSFAPHPITLRQLQYVVAVSQTLSFRKAAERCRVSQPSLSAQLAQLEAALSVRLFERDKKRVMPTQAGKALIERAQRLVLDADELVLAARRAADPLTGTLTLGVIPTIAPYLLPSITPALRKAFPKLGVAWIEDKTEALTKLLAAGSLDAALVALEAELGDVEHAVIAKDPFVLVTRRDHPLAQQRAEVSRTELRDTDVLLLDDGHCFREQALEYCTRAKAHELALRATSLATLTQMVAGGMGVTLLPQLAVPTETARTGLKIRPFTNPAPYRTIALIWRKRSAITDALQKLAEVLQASYPKR
jgi:LysR family transcriptional regulator, hydrogen peroxide-inducible genes activator